MRLKAPSSHVVTSEAGPRPRPVWDKVAERVQVLLTDSAQWTGGKQRLTATRLHALLVAEGHAVGVTAVKAAVAEWNAVSAAPARTRRRAAAAR